MQPDLSIVIPAYNEAVRLMSAFDQIFEELHNDPQTLTVEIVVVCNGCTDGSYDVANKLARQSLPANMSLVVIDLPMPSKVEALRVGMARAAGLYRLMTDADLSTPVEEWSKITSLLDRGADVALGSRYMRGAKVRMTLKRRLFGLGFHLLTSLVVPGIHDTQTGCKAFTARAADTLFPRLMFESLAFDVELLHLAQRLDFKIAEVPVAWTADPDSRVNLARDSWRMAKEVGSLLMTPYPYEPTKGEA